MSNNKNKNEMVMATTKIEYIDGQISILFPPDFLEKLKLKNGEVLQWFIEDKDTIIIKKVNLIT